MAIDKAQGLSTRAPGLIESINSVALCLSSTYRDSLVMSSCTEVITASPCVWCLWWLALAFWCHYSTNKTKQKQLIIRIEIGEIRQKVPTYNSQYNAIYDTLEIWQAGSGLGYFVEGMTSDVLDVVSTTMSVWETCISFRHSSHI